MIFWPNLAAPLLRWIPIWYGLEVFVFPARVETVSTHAIPEASFFFKKRENEASFLSRFGNLGQTGYSKSTALYGI